MDIVNEWTRPEVIWFIIGLVLLLTEFAMPGLIIFFFGAGAWVVSVVCLVAEISLNTQLVIFIVSSVFLLFLLRSRLKPLFYGFSTSRELTEDIEEFIGETAIVREEIRGRKKGRVEFHGTHWDAVSDEDIPAGTTVEITGKDNITLKVRSI